jgi:energy-coupling factor transporter ATP-binding protein EcfA2
LKRFRRWPKKRDLRKFKPPDTAKREHHGIIIDVQGLWHIYESPAAEGIRKTEAVRDINLRIEKGEFVVIVGQNGSGKTTLVKHFNGLLKPSRGSVLVNGVDTRTVKTGILARTVGYVFQNPDHQICNSTVREELSFGPKNIHVPRDEIERRVSEVGELLKLKEHFDVSPYSLSKGERQQVAVASVLAMEPEVIVVDEPTTGQDYRGSKFMMDLMVKMNNRGKTIIVITHDMNIAAEYGERVVVMRQGGILLDGPPRQVFSEEKPLAETYLRPPQMSIVGKKLGIPFTVLTADEMFSLLTERQK